jgi:hypothetical protein
MASRRDDQIRDALEQIREANGGVLKREDIVRAARPARHVLHSEFIWDDRKAAHKQRLDRAGELIRFITVTVVHESMRIVSPYYVSNPDRRDNEAGHVPITATSINRSAAERIVLAEVMRCKSSIERARDVTHMLDSRHPGLSGLLQRMLQELIDLEQRLAA